MPEKTISISPTPQQDHLLLFIDWLQVLISQQVGVVSYGGVTNNWQLRLKDDSVCQISLTQGSVRIAFPEKIAQIADQLVTEAWKKMEAKDFGEPVWWMIGMKARSELDETNQLHMMRNMHEHKRFQGPWKFSNDVLLKFTQANLDAVPAFIAEQEVEIVFRTLGPCHGFLSSSVAGQWASRLRAILTFVSGAPHGSYVMPFPATDEERDEAKRLLTDPSIRELFVENIQLGPYIIWLFQASEGLEAVNRVINAMFAYEFALDQKSAPAALIFLVTAIEALAVPNTSWQKERVVKRFREFLLLACPETVDQVMQHVNFVEAFGPLKSRNSFIDKLYSLRSHPVHTGQLAGPSGLLQGSTNEGIRVALASTLTRAAIVSFLQKPFSLLWGHPNLDPAVQLKLTFEEYALLQEHLKLIRKKSVPDWIRLLALETARQALKVNDRVKLIEEMGRQEPPKRREQRRQKRGKK